MQTLSEHEKGGCCCENSEARTQIWIEEILQ